MTAGGLIQPGSTVPDGWQLVSGAYHHHERGRGHTGWFEEGDDSWCWLSASGAMVHSTPISINGTRHALDGSGR